MTETQALLGKIAALRQRLEQARGLAEDAGSAAAALVEAPAARPDPVQALRQKVARGARSAELVDSSLRLVPGLPAPAEPEGPLPASLTARARRLVPQVRDLLARLRGLADEPALSQGEDDPLAAALRETTALAELAVRVLQTLPEAPSPQLRLCEGVEALVRSAARRAAALDQAAQEHREEQRQVDTLAGLLAALAGGRPADLGPALALADQVVREAAEARPLRFLYTAPSDPARFAACHSLTVARVAARVARHLPDWRGRPHQPVLGALLHDVGMLRVPAEILAQPGPLDEAQRREVEKHAAAGTEMLAALGPDAAWLRDIAAGHHEKVDGTGYPAGLRDLQIAPLVSLLAACDVYAALCCPRPQRPALDTRTALTDTLTVAQQGAFSPDCAQALLELTLYPVGAAVELADGALGVVVATHPCHKDINRCARPVVALLTDSQGRPLPSPMHLDLAACEGRSIVRSLPAAERRQLLGPAYPEWT
jgi:HD-GYP domain-containing protein (c-di-GMP phosphodiesterase class II)